MTLLDDLTRTAALLTAGWPITNLSRAKRAQEQQTMLTADQCADLEDLIERATPILVELRRACSGPAKFDAHDDDLAAALVVVDSTARVHSLVGLPLVGRRWLVETTEFRVTATVEPGSTK